MVGSGFLGLFSRGVSPFEPDTSKVPWLNGKNSVFGLYPYSIWSCTLKAVDGLWSCKLEAIIIHPAAWESHLFLSTNNVHFLCRADHSQAPVQALTCVWSRSHHCMAELWVLVKVDLFVLWLGRPLTTPSRMTSLNIHGIYLLVPKQLMFSADHSTELSYIVWPKKLFHAHIKLLGQLRLWNAMSFVIEYTF
jgi:hypothetical protein